MSEWLDVKTAPIGPSIDVYVWSVGMNGVTEDGFRWCDVRLKSDLPQTLLVFVEEVGGEGHWDDYELSQNGQFASHWMFSPDAPECPSPPSPILEQEKGK